jgi:hypothetical protein
MGGSVMALYATDLGDVAPANPRAPLRETKDVDAIVTVGTPAFLYGIQKLVSNGVLAPDERFPPTMCRYRFRGQPIHVDFVTLDGSTTGGVNRWLAEGARNCAEYDAGEDTFVRAITPPYFLLAKLVALQDPGRTGDLGIFHHDAEDVVALLAEATGVPRLVRDAGVGGSVRDELRLTFQVHNVRDPVDLVDSHLGENARVERDRIVEDLAQLIAGC